MGGKLAREAGAPAGAGSARGGNAAAPSRCSNGYSGGAASSGRIPGIRTRSPAWQALSALWMARIGYGTGPKPSKMLIGYGHSNSVPARLRRVLGTPAMISQTPLLNSVLGATAALGRVNDALDRASAATEVDSVAAHQSLREVISIATDLLGAAAAMINKENDRWNI